MRGINCVQMVLVVIVAGGLLWGLTVWSGFSIIVWVSQVCKVCSRVAGWWLRRWRNFVVIAPTSIGITIIIGWRMFSLSIFRKSRQGVIGRNYIWRLGVKCFPCPYSENLDKVEIS